MASVKAHEADRALAKPDPAWRLFLIYGPDAGLVSERATALATAQVDDAADPFQLVRMAGDDIASDPLRLIDEANTIGLFGGRRAIRVSATGRPLLAAVEPLLATPSRDAVVIVEAGDLQRNNPLRAACERAQSALAVPCYGDAARDLAGIVDEMLRGAGKTIDRTGREQLVDLLGGDRQTSRREIEKLLLYVGSESIVAAEAIEAVVGDTAERAQSALVDAVFAGRLPALDLVQTKLANEGLDAGVMLGAMLRHALSLLAARQAMATGRSARDAVTSMRLPFPRLAAAEAALAVWTQERLIEAIGHLDAAQLSARRDGEVGKAIAQRTLWRLAQQARGARG